MLENLAKTEMNHVKTVFALHSFLLWFAAMPSPPPQPSWVGCSGPCLFAAVSASYQDER